MGSVLYSVISRMGIAAAALLSEVPRLSPFDRFLSCQRSFGAWAAGIYIEHAQELPRIGTFFLAPAREELRLWFWGAGNALLAINCPQPSSGEGSCAAMQSTSFNKNIPGKEAGVRFSQPAFPAHQTAPSAP